MKNKNKTAFLAYFRRIKKYLPQGKQSNLKVVLLCLLAATTFWFFNALNKNNYTTKISYPVQFEYNRDSLIAVNPLPESILIEVTGGGWNVLRKYLRLNSKPISIPIDQPVATKLIPSENIVPIVAEKFGELKVNFIQPDTIFLNFEQKVSMDIRVKVDSAGIDLEDGYQIISPISVKPEKVTATGPLSEVQSIGNTIPLSIPDDKINDNYEEEIYLDYDVPGLVSISPREVTVHFEVGENEQREENVQLIRKNFPSGRELTINPVSVKISFMVPEVSNGERDIDFQIVADYNTMNLEDSTLIPEITKKPDFVEIIDIIPEKLKVNYEHR